MEADNNAGWRKIALVLSRRSLTSVHECMHVHGVSACAWCELVHVHSVSARSVGLYMRVYTHTACMYFGHHAQVHLNVVM